MRGFKQERSAIMNDASFAAAAAAIRDADALIITAGAGMGVDSGLPDFRGDEGFWRAYPPMKAAGLSFVDMANPHWFRSEPERAWGFYGHRLELYRQTTPHDGFTLLRRWAGDKEGGAFVFTSNVDGQFQRAGFDDEQVYEVHGSLMHLQCVHDCRGTLWSAEGTSIDVDLASFRARSALPLCDGCGALARPALLMFGDGDWNSTRSDAQAARYERWLAARAGSRVAVIEVGAGTHIPTVRLHSERLVRAIDATLIRINPREAQGPHGTISLDCGAAAGLARIAALL